MVDVRFRALVAVVVEFGVGLAATVWWMCAEAVAPPQVSALCNLPIIVSCLGSAD